MKYKSIEYKVLLNNTIIDKFVTFEAAVLNIIERMGNNPGLKQEWFGIVKETSWIEPVDLSNYHFGELRSR